MEAALRLGIFLAAFVALALLERLRPRRERTQPAASRWRTNLGLLLVDVAAQRLTLGAVAVAAALLAQERGLGLLTLVAWPAWLEGLIAFVLLDAAVWLQHLVTHKVPLLWRLHQVHHADLDVDLSTGVRFHPLEILLSALWKAVMVLALGAGIWAVILFEAVLNAASIFTHANLGLPERLDRGLRWVVCTPDMHRIHHSIDRAETDSNYGFCLSIWDRLFATLRHDPARGQLGLELGLARHRDPARLGLLALLRLPFGREPPQPGR